MELFDPKKEKYITRGIETEIPIDYQFMMFSAIEKWRNKNVQLDYLQVFRLSVERDSNGNRIQIIEHRQEIPKMNEEIRFQVEDAGVTNQIFVIDDGGKYFTMLLASEY